MATTIINSTLCQEEKAVVEGVVPHSAGEPDHTQIKQSKVQSVELTNAIVKDNPNYWSASQMQLYGIMFFVTLSMSPKWYVMISS